MTILSLIFGFCIELCNLMVYLMTNVLHINKPVLAYKEHRMQENEK